MNICTHSHTQVSHAATVVVQTSSSLAVSPLSSVSLSSFLAHSLSSPHSLVSLLSPLSLRSLLCLLSPLSPSSLFSLFSLSHLSPRSLLSLLTLFPLSFASVLLGLCSVNSSCISLSLLLNLYFISIFWALLLSITMRLGISSFISDILSTSSNICFCWTEGKVESILLHLHHCSCAVEQGRAGIRAQGLWVLLGTHILLFNYCCVCVYVCLGVCVSSFGLLSCLRLD